MRELLLSLLFVFTSVFTFSQGTTCGTAINLGTPPSGTPSCSSYTFSAGGSSPCAGAGYGGAGFVMYFNFCTNASNDCIDFIISNATAGNFAATVYTTGCGSVAGAECMGNSGAGSVFNTNNLSGSGLAANTCYTVRLWSKDGGSFDMCWESVAEPNDECVGAMPIDAVPQSTNNICYSEGVTDPAPATMCAGSIENSAWYEFQVLATADVVITIDNITCAGGAAGFQIGYYTGTCGSLTNIGCNSGSGGTVTTTITGLTAGETVYVAIDGNAGANCAFDISATNTVPLPVDVTGFYVYNQDQKNTLSWNTQSEIDNSHFIIQRQTTDGGWENIGTVSGNGNSSSLIEYSFEDERYLNGINYYRLVQYNNNGISKYMGVVMMDNRIENKEIIKVYNVFGQEVNSDYSGVVIYLYSDGTTEKEYRNTNQ